MIPTPTTFVIGAGASKAISVTYRYGTKADGREPISNNVRTNESMD